MPKTGHALPTEIYAGFADEPDYRKHCLPGTDRARSTAEALAVARGAAPLVGVTRIADITGLDVCGVPTFQAIRPASRTLALSQGKGVTSELAELSAVMESIETWHVEQPLTAEFVASPRDLAGQLTYDVETLPQTEPSLLHADLPIGWVRAVSLADGGKTFVPVDAVRLSFESKADWFPPAFLSSTNGLASGNTGIEAVLHGLYEVIERDAVTAAVRTGDLGRDVDPATQESALVDQLCTAIARAGVVLNVKSAASPTGLPCFLARVACEDYPMWFYGFGCHLSSEIALTRAITEAVQARLAHIAGARDDIKTDAYAGMSASNPALRGGASSESRGGVVQRSAAHDRLVDDFCDVVDRAMSAFGSVPLMVDLTRAEIGVSVVKVIAPGGRITPEVL